MERHLTNDEADRLIDEHFNKTKVPYTVSIDTKDIINSIHRLMNVTEETTTAFKGFYEIHTKPTRIQKFKSRLKSFFKKK